MVDTIKTIIAYATLDKLMWDHAMECKGPTNHFVLPISYEEASASNIEEVATSSVMTMCFLKACLNTKWSLTSDIKEWEHKPPSFLVMEWYERTPVGPVLIDELMVVDGSDIVESAYRSHRLRTVPCDWKTLFAELTNPAKLYSLVRTGCTCAPPKNPAVRFFVT